MMKLKKNGYPYFMIDFEAKAAAQNFALVLKTAEWEGPLPASKRTLIQGAACFGSLT